MTTIAVIPARGGSKRLLRKNIYPIFGKPMLAWSIEACQRSALIDEIYVSTEDDEIAQVAQDYNAKLIMRPESLSDDDVPKMEVIRHADKYHQEQTGRAAKVLLSVQANSPELNANDIDKGVKMLNQHNLFEVITVGADMIQNASFRVIRQSSLYNTFLSAHIGVIQNDCTDVHTLSDVESIELRYQTLTNFVEHITR